MKEQEIKFIYEGFLLMYGLMFLIGALIVFSQLVFATYLYQIIPLLLISLFLTICGWIIIIKHYKFCKK